MALLNFKYGKHGNLPEWSLGSVGTVFVTTDEQAMHIDLPDGRVVISQIINVASVTEWQNMKPPYSTQAFYYIVDANALLKYTGDGTAHSWKQINSTTDVQNAIDSLTAIVGTKDDNGNWTEGSLGATVATHSTDIANIKSDIQDLKDKDAVLEKAIQDVAGDVTDVEALVHNLDKVVGYAGAFDTDEAALEKINAGEVCLVGGVIKLCSVDDAGVKTLSAYNTVITEIEILKKTVKDLSDNSADDTDLIELQGRVEALEDWKAELVLEIGEPASADGSVAATGMYALIAAAQAQADLAKSIADEALAGANKANEAIGVPSGTDENGAATPATGLYEKIEKNATDIVTNAGNIKTNADDIDALEGRANTLETTVGDANGGLVKDVADHTTAIGENAEAIAGNTEDIATNAENIGKNSTAITEEVARAKAAEEANTKAIADLRKEVMEDIQTADAMVFKDVVASEAELIAKEATAEIGHTYKAADEFTLTQGDSVISVHVGDLLIATGAENAETGIITDVVWKHVPSGYVADYNPKIEAAEDVEGDNEVVLALSSGVAKDQADLANRGDLGKITLATAEGSALTVSTDNAGKVTFSMVWESFDPVTTE